MTAPARHLRPAARATATCTACGQPMALGGGGRQRQLRLIPQSPTSTSLTE